MFHCSNCAFPCLVQFTQGVFCKDMLQENRGMILLPPSKLAHSRHGMLHKDMLQKGNGLVIEQESCSVTGKEHCRRARPDSVSILVSAKCRA